MKLVLWVDSPRALALWLVISSERANYSSEDHDDHDDHEQSGCVCLLKNTQLNVTAYSNVIKGV